MAINYKTREHILQDVILSLKHILENDTINVSLDKNTTSLNVDLDDKGSNYDSVRIGNGTYLLSINDDGSINISNKYEDKLAKYAISRSDSTTSNEYYGFISTENEWYILKVDTLLNTYTYSNGTVDFLTNWSNRATLTYSEFNTLTW